MRCKINFRFYILLLCAVYFTMLYVFHGSLQTESKKHGRDLGSGTVEMQNGILKVESPIEAKRKVLASRQDPTEIEPKSVLVEHMLTTVSGEKKHDFNTSTYQLTPDFSKDCFLPATSPKRMFVALEPKFFVYSAYLDERYKERIIRIMALLSLNKSNRKLQVFCNYRKSNGLLQQQPAQFYELCENHGRMFGGFILSCPASHDDVCHINLSLKIEAKHHNYMVPETVPVQLPVSVTRFDKPVMNMQTYENSENLLPYNFTICVPPMFGNIDSIQFVEFIELNQLLGFQHFIFYISSVNNKDMFQVLDYYKNIGTITTIDWNIPSTIHNGHIWYNGQLSAHNDCLYRAMSLTHYLAIIDLDEFIVPHNGQRTLTDMIPKLFGNNICGLSFDSAFYDKNFSKSKSQSRLMTVTNTGRTAVFSKVRTKVIVKPSKVFEIGIHHISKPLSEDYKVEKVDTSVAFLHHYRECLPNYGMRCATVIEDNTLLNYSADLETNVSNVLKTVFATRG